MDAVKSVAWPRMAYLRCLRSFNKFKLREQCEPRGAERFQREVGVYFSLVAVANATLLSNFISALLPQPLQIIE